MGISYHTPISYGNALSCISLCILMIDLLMHESIGLGTVLDAILIGVFLDLFSSFQLLPQMNDYIFASIFFIIGLFIMAIGQYFYMSSGLGCGARDTLLLAIGKRLSHFPIGGVNIII